MAWSSAKPYRR